MAEISGTGGDDNLVGTLNDAIIVGGSASDLLLG